MENQPVSILYIGDDSEVIALLNNKSLFVLHVESTGLSAFKWLTDGEFKVFERNEHLKRKVEIDAIVSETNLRGLNGVFLFKKMKQANLLDNICFILLTGQAKTSFGQHVLKSGINGVFPKPVMVQQLYDRIKLLQRTHSGITKNEPHKEISTYHTPFIKRLFDILVSSITLVVLSPVMLITAIAIRLESTGPVIYKAKRIGANFKTFDFYKFRSMYSDADKRLKELAHLNQYAVNDEVEVVCAECAKLPPGELCSPAYYLDGERICENLAIKRHNAKKAFLKIQNDPRVTKVGRFIRNTSIDELPQLFNVLKGDMSIVGNRPLPVYEAYAITKSRWSRRFITAAGLTGLWQVELRGRGGFMSEEERFKLDNKYAHRNSFWGDIKLLLRTIPAIFQKSDA